MGAPVSGQKGSWRIGRTDKGARIFATSIQE
jgi:hypothetical protein